MDEKIIRERETNIMRDIYLSYKEEAQYMTFKA